jgi:hypothetical protein
LYFFLYHSKKYLEVPSNPLPTLDIFNGEETNLREINEEMRIALREIIIDDEQKVTLKSKPNNPMLKAREKKAKSNNEASSQSTNNIDKQDGHNKDFVKEKSKNEDNL